MWYIYMCGPVFIVPLFRNKCFFTGWFKIHYSMLPSACIGTQIYLTLLQNTTWSKTDYNAREGTKAVFHIGSKKMSWILRIRGFLFKTFFDPWGQVGSSFTFLLKLFHMRNHQSISEKLVLSYIWWLWWRYHSKRCCFIFGDHVEDNIKTSPQAKRHKQSLLFNFSTILNFITR